MTTKEYVKKYNLDNPEFANHFNTNLFLEDLKAEFMDRVRITVETRKNAGLEFDFRIFQIIIGEIQNKFSAISNKKACGPLRKELWGAFYAKVIIPFRKEYFPKEHEEIENRRNRALAKKAEQGKISEMKG